MPNIPRDNAKAEKMDDDDLFNFDIPEPKVKQESITDYYHDAGAFEGMPVTPAEGEIFAEQGLEIPSDIGKVTLQDLQETFERTSLNDFELGYRKWEVEMVTEGEGLRYPTYAY